MEGIHKDLWPQAWIDAWNAHDLPRILSHYAQDMTMVSPMIRRLMGEPSARLNGKNAVASYWQAALSRVPDLHFELISACWGEESLVLTYKGVGGRIVSELLQFNESQLVCHAHAHYAE